MIKVNLLPVRAARKKETFMNQIYIGILVIIISLGVVGWRAYSMQERIKGLEREISQKKKELAELKDIEKEVEEFKAKNKVLQDKVSVITSLEEGRDWFIQVIDHISQSIPEEVWVTSLSMGGRGGRGATAVIYSAPVKLDGGAYRKDDIGYFISNLESNKEYISRVSLGKITQKGGGRTEGEYYNYDLTINIKPPPKEGK
jgi:type IV pilus assembly protein PilN